MAGRRKEQLVPTNSLVASSVAYSGIGKVAQVYRPVQRWQREAWDFYDITPELRFAAGWVANAMSRIVLRPGKVNDAGDVERSDSPATRKALDAVFGGNEGQAAMLHAVGLHLTVAGECYLVGRAAPAGVKTLDGRIWEIVGVHEVHGTSAAGSRWSIDSSIDGRLVDLTDSDTVMRIWRPHPDRRFEADSPVRALLSTLTEIKYHTLHIFAQSRSRLAGAGVQVMPDEVEFPPPRDENGNEITGLSKAESLTRSIGQAMAKAINDPSSPEALVPIFITVPATYVEKIREPLHYWSPFDDKVIEARRSAVQRFGVGMDLPPEVIFGMTSNASSSGGVGTGASHWTSWQIEESAIKLHIEPLAGVFVNELIIRYLRVVTSDPTAAIYVDSTALKLQPDRSKEAAEAHDRGALSDEGYRFYNGLDEQYAPQVEDIKRRILWKMASGSASPEMVLAAAAKLGIDLGLTAADIAGSPPAPQTRPDPSLNGHPQRVMPETRMQLLSALSEPLVLRALERVGNRLRNQGVKPPGVPATEVYRFHCTNGGAERLLEGAWELIPTVADGYCDATALTAALNAYVESLLTEQAPYDRAAMQRYLTLVEA